MLVQRGPVILGDPYGDIFSQVHIIKLGDFLKIGFQANLGDVKLQVENQSDYKTKETLNGFYMILFMKITIFFQN